MNLDRLDRLWSIVESQESKIRQLHVHQEALRLENRALRNCLRATGYLSEHQFQAELLQAGGTSPSQPGPAPLSPVPPIPRPRAHSPPRYASPSMSKASGTPVGRAGVTSVGGLDSIRRFPVQSDQIRDIDVSLSTAGGALGFQTPQRQDRDVRTAIREDLTPRRLQELEVETSERAEDAREVAENSVKSGWLADDQELEDVRQRVYRASFNAKLRDLEGRPLTPSIMQDEQWAHQQLVREREAIDEQWAHQQLARERESMEASKYEDMTFQSVSSLLPAWNTDCGSPSWPRRDLSFESLHLR